MTPHPDGASLSFRHTGEGVTIEAHTVAGLLWLETFVQRGPVAHLTDDARARDLAKRAHREFGLTVEQIFEGAQ